jgi:hypothetical protein
MGASGRFNGRVTINYPAMAFPPGDTLIQGDICYHYQPGETDQRIYIREDSTQSRCNADHLSPFIDICSPNPTCAMSGEFSDVPSGSTFSGDIAGLASAGAVSGYTDGTFRPNATTTRAQLAKIVALAFGIPADAQAQAHFSDVSSTHPFFSYIEALYSRGLLSGYADGTFRPYEAVTRGQVAKIVVSAAGYKLENPAAPSFSDVAVGTTYYQYIETARSHGILSGYPDGTFRAGSNATRGQIAKIVNGAATVQHEINGHRPAGESDTYRGGTR